MNAALGVFLIVALVCLGVGLFLDKVLTPWISKRWVEKTLRRIEKGEIASTVHDISIVWDLNGFLFQNEKTMEKSPGLPWASVVKVTAFKRDLWSTDRICLFFETADGKGIETHEESNGWSKFIEDLPEHLPGCKPSPDWLWNVASPAFAPNVTEIFSRIQSSPAVGDLAR